MEEDRQTGRGKEAEQAAVYDGMEILGTPPTKLRFGKDLRLLEVRVAATPTCALYFISVSCFINVFCCCQILD